MTVATIIAQNYLAYARVLADSYAEHHPGGRLVVLVTDSKADAHGEPFEVVHPAELDLDQREFRRLAAIYDATELATALKPWFLRHLLARGEPALYLDPDVEIHGSLDEAASAAREHGIVLTPHTLEPIPRDGQTPTEHEVLRAGVFNLGFLGVGPEALPFLDWWGDRLRRDCLIAPEEELFVDQRPVDLVPAYFEHLVLRDPGYNVAYWNLHERTLTRARGVYEVNGRPLRFFHFSGFDPHRPDVLSRHGTRATRAAEPTVRDLARAYAARLLASGYDAQSNVPYGFARTASGVPLDRRLRRHLRAADAAGAPPDAFDPRQKRAFDAWLRQRGSLGSLSAARRAVGYVGMGPDPGSPVRWIRVARRTMLRVLRHYDGHQRKVAIALLDALREVEASSAADLASTREELARALREIEARIEAVEQAAPDPRARRSLSVPGDG